MSASTRHTWCYIRNIRCSCLNLIFNRWLYPYSVLGKEKCSLISNPTGDTYESSDDRQNVEHLWKGNSMTFILTLAHEGSPSRDKWQRLSTTKWNEGPLHCLHWRPSLVINRMTRRLARRQNGVKVEHQSCKKKMNCTRLRKTQQEKIPKWKTPEYKLQQCEPNIGQQSYNLHLLSA